MFTSCGGQLDLDDRGGSYSIKVENIYFRSMSELKDGRYVFWINPYAIANSKGFKAEIEFNGEIYSYSYNNPLRGSVEIAEVIVNKGEFSIETNQFHKVNLICLSPNHWGENNVGNKHYFFMLENCKSPTSIRSFHNENLLPELAVHRKVLEVLGATNMIESTEKQLSGLGFNATVKDELIVKLQGTHKRIIKIKF